MKIALRRNLWIVAIFFLLGGCTSSGIVSNNVKLSLAEVVVIKNGGDNDNIIPGISHDLGEEIHYEFSRVTGKKYRQK
jgi:hypothetical protein